MTRTTANRLSVVSHDTYQYRLCISEWHENMWNAGKSWQIDLTGSLWQCLPIKQPAMQIIQKHCHTRKPKYQSGTCPHQSWTTAQHPAYLQLGCANPPALWPGYVSANSVHGAQMSNDCSAQAYPSLDPLQNRSFEVAHCLCSFSHHGNIQLYADFIHAWFFEGKW